VSSTGAPSCPQRLAATKAVKCSVVVAKLNRLSCDVAFAARPDGPARPLLVAKLGRDADPFMLHLYAAFKFCLLRSPCMGCKREAGVIES